MDNKYSEKKEGSRCFIQVRWRHPIQKLEKNIQYPYPLEQRYSLSLSPIFVVVARAYFPSKYNLLFVQIINYFEY